ncbi:MAG: ATP-binding cassette domain-containing protein [Lachnospirales bacterium]
MKIKLLDEMLGVVEENYPYAVDYFEAVGISVDTWEKTNSIRRLIDVLDDDFIEDVGTTKVELKQGFIMFIERMEALKDNKQQVEEITILGGKNKLGKDEDIKISIKKGDVVSIVGPTGSGKSRLLADIECLAQRDTQTRRKILINGKEPKKSERFTIENKLIAQLSQNMNYVMDLSVIEFIRLHGESRMIQDVDYVSEKIFSYANELAGESFKKDTPLTQLSGGQSRALMIADTALLSVSPIVLIDEIENAGVDRKKALELLVKEEKIVLMSTHDPILALLGEKRIVIENGGIKVVKTTTEKEKYNLEKIENIDKKMLQIRNKIRVGENIDFNIDDYFGFENRN